MAAARPLVRLRAVAQLLRAAEARAGSAAAECSGCAASLAAAARAWGPPPASPSMAAAAQAWRAHSSAAASAAPQAAATDATAQQQQEGLRITDAAADRLRELAAAQGGEPLVLRLSVEGGGCSGFQYEFTLEGAPREGDRVFEQGGARVVCDTLSLEFLGGAVIDYESDLMRSAFVVQENPHAAASCGCGASFAAK